MPREKLLLADANSLFHQAFHAIAELRNREGLPTNAVFGLANMLLRVLDEERPAAIALAFDTPEPTFRHRQFADYKGHRPPMDDALVRQLPLIDELVAAFALPALRAPGFEADDILATLAERAKDDWEVLILTADRDLCQMAEEHITVLASSGAGSAETRRFDPPTVRERYGVDPERMPDWKALVGDPSDNIPGVPGIGEKTATQLLQTYGDLESVLAAADSMKGKRRENLLAYADQARLGKQLCTLCREAPVDAPIESLRRRDPDHEAISKLFTRLEFHSLLRRLSPRTTTPPQALSYHLAEQDWAVRMLCREVEEARIVGLAWCAEPPGVAVATAPSRAWLVPLGEVDAVSGGLFGDACVASPEARDRLSLVLAHLREEGRGWVAHDAQKLYTGLGADAPELAHLLGDTHLASWLLDPERAEHSLEALSQRHLGTPPPGAAPEGMSAAMGAACVEADLVRRLEPLLREELAEDKLVDLYLSLELPLAPLLARMMAAGMVVDRERTAELSSELGGRIAEVEQDIYEQVGHSFTIASPKQLGEVLFGELGLARGRKTRTGSWSTDAATLQTLREDHPVIDRILEYRELTKLKSTYLDALLALSDESGRIRTSLNQTGAATGRLSSSRPNLQNIPVRGDWGTRLRDIFCAPPGWRLLAADYSQIELRLLAHISGDRRLLEAFRQGEDIHAAAASELFGVAPEAVTADMRRRAKVLNFGIAYGIQAHGLSQRLEIPRPDAQALIDAYFERFPGVRQYAEDVVARGRESGWVQSLFGRRRRVPDLRSPNPNLRQAAERMAINMPIQGSASDVIKRAMLALDSALAAGGFAARQVLQVHDELLLEVPPDEVEPVAARVRAAMEGAAELDVPLAVDLKVGERWGSMAGL